MVSPMMPSTTAPTTKAPIVAGLLFLDMTCLLGRRSAVQESPHFLVRMRIAELARVPLRDHCTGLDVEKHAVRTDRENAGQLVRDDDHRGSEALAKLDDQLVEQA